MSAILSDFGWLNDTMIFWSAIVLICVVPTITYYVYRWRKIEIDAELKREMLARGMSADEIERVLAAGSPSGPKGQSTARASFKDTQPYQPH